MNIIHIILVLTLNEYYSYYFSSNTKWIVEIILDFVT